MAGDRLGEAVESTSLADLARRGVLSFGDGYRTMRAELGSSGFPILRVAQVADGFIWPTSSMEYVREEFRRSIGPKLSRPDDVVLTTKGTFGRRAYIRPEDADYVYSPQVCWFRIVDRARVEPRYFYSWLGSSDFTSQAHGMKSQTDMADYLSLRDLARINVPLPPLPQQRAIAHILGTLDDKSELNRRMNATLEAIAGALFKSWFVDFDPVRAKSEGRDPGLLQPFADLFPDSFDGSEFGKVPEGWGTQRFGDLLDLDKGLSYKGQFLGETGMPMVNLGCFLGRGRFAELAIKQYSGEFKGRHVVRPRDLVMANTDLTQKREVIGSPALIPPREGLDQLLFTHHVFAARFREGKEPWKLFVYFSLLQEEFRERATGFAAGTTVLALPRDTVLDLQSAAPPPALIGGFDSIVLPLIERQWKAQEESRSLAELRDTLLPKLISGELRVHDAERLAAGAGA